jgi:hypothetical protein
VCPVEANEQQKLVPFWMYNSNVGGDSKWKHLPTAKQHPAFCPASLQTYNSPFVVTGPADDLLPSAVRSGVFLTVENLKNILEVVPYEMKPPFHGANGAKVKLDYARGLVNKYFEQEPEAETNRMVQCIMGQYYGRVHCPQQILDAINSMEASEKKDFQGLHETVLNQEDVHSKIQADRAASDKLYLHKEGTPALLKSLVPPVAGCGLNRKGSICRYFAWVPRNLVQFIFTAESVYGLV